MLRKLFVTAAAAGVLSLGVAGAARAQSPNDNSVFFTFNHAVTVPTKTLPAGRYLFQIANASTNRSIVEIFSDDHAKLFGTFMTIPAEFGHNQLGQSPGDTGVTFIEAPANAPMPVQSWWYPGRQQGWEFVYPKNQARLLAKSAKEPVLATASDTAVTADQMNNAPLERISSGGQETPVSGDHQSASAESSSSSANQSAAMAGDSSTTLGADANRSTSSTSMASTRTRLPKTASDLPIAALAGLVTLIAGLGLSRRRVS